MSELLIEVNWVFSVVPRPLTTAMIASAMPAAIKPYSIAVAPDSLDKNFLMCGFKILTSNLAVPPKYLGSLEIAEKI